MSKQITTPPSLPNLSADLLVGAAAIAEFLFGDVKQRRKVYHLAETSKIPIFRLGSVLCARRAVLLEWIKCQEDRGKGPYVFDRIGEAGDEDQQKDGLNCR